jgi:hypothetical protein
MLILAVLSLVVNVLQYTQNQNLRKLHFGTTVKTGENSRVDNIDQKHFGVGNNVVDTKK